ncbi:uncharacterized protein LOC101895294 isoform X1 [Musca domestica]|uniref:Uncharacterized protein LOC101895294 isoform X1 n=1 Tax=Musca domestica TaxID=7370 RepID=A0A9J7DBB6_MUSDO|nr:uncharacterized protein LOC101895294 isoform X1 [Musca domestica]
MLPPPPIPPTTHSTAMRISTTSPPPADNSKHQQRKQQQQQQQHNESAFVYSPADEAKQSSPTAVKANATMNATTQRLKAILNRTLTQVSSPYSNNNNSNINTSISDYTAQYFGSSVLASGSPQLSPPPLHLSSPGSYGSQDDDDDFVYGRINDGRGLVGNISEGFDSYATAVATLAANGTANHLEATTAATTAAAAVSAFPTATQTVATFMAGNKNRATTIIVYPTVSPESIVIPIVSCIFGFPILAFIVICCLRHRAKMARERDRRRNYDMQDHAVSLVRFSPIHRLNYRSSRAISLRPERSLSQGFTSLELDTVVEERCSDVEQTQTEILHPESPMESSTSYKMSLSSS